MEWWQIIILVALLIVIGIGAIAIVRKQNPAFLSRASIQNYYLNTQLKRLAKDRDYFYFKDVYIQVGEQSYIKYDGIMIGVKYIYVIAQRHWIGTLNGNIYDNKWIVSNSEAINVDNPIFGARVRVEALMQLLKVEIDDFVNIISLGKRVKYKNPIITNNPNELIVPFGAAVKTILKCEKESSLNDVTDEEMMRIANLIDDENRACREGNKTLR